MSAKIDAYWLHSYATQELISMGRDPSVPLTHIAFGRTDGQMESHDVPSDLPSVLSALALLFPQARYIQSHDTFFAQKNRLLVEAKRKRNLPGS